MADEALPLTAFSPQSWYVVFSTETDARFVRWLAVGRYKHVSACGYVPGERIWLFVDPRLKRTVVEAVRDGAVAEARLAEAMRSHEVLVMPANEPATFRLRAGLWCVPLVASLVGVRSSALRPDAFYRDCLQAGARRLDDLIATPEESPSHGTVRPEENRDSA